MISDPKKITYKPGLNTFDQPLNITDPTQENGFFVFDVKNILTQLNFGSLLHEIVIPIADPELLTIKSKKRPMLRTNRVIINRTHDLSKNETFIYLFSIGADLRIENDLPLKWASSNGHLEIMKFLIGKGANFHIDRNLPIRTAAKKGFTEMVAYLIGIEADFKAESEYALRHAADKGHIEIVKLLAKNGSDVLINDSEAVIWAAHSGHLVIVIFLVEICHADPTSKNSRALRWACLNGHLDVVKYLIKKGADVEAKRGEPVKMAKRGGHSHLISFLMQKINRTNS